LDERDEEDAETEIQLVAEAELETSGCIALLQQVDRDSLGPTSALGMPCMVTTPTGQGTF
jgi:uncharacterized membrane protein